MIELLYTSRLSGTADIFLILLLSVPYALASLVPGAWLPARHGERLKMTIVAAACLSLALVLIGLRGQMTPLVVATSFTAIWILQSIAMFWSASRIAGMRILWNGTLICPTASASIIIGKIIDCRSIIVLSTVVTIFCLSLDWRRIHRAHRRL